MSRELKFRNWKNGFSFLNLLEDNDNDFYEFYRYGDDIITNYEGEILLLDSEKYYSTAKKGKWYRPFAKKN